MQTIEKVGTHPARVSGLVRWLALGVLCALVAAAVLALTGDAALAQNTPINGGSADVASGIDEGQALGVGLIGLAAVVILAVLVIKRSWAAVFICCIGAAFALMFASDPTGSVTTAVASVFELLTGQA